MLNLAQEAWVVDKWDEPGIGLPLLTKQIADKLCQFIHQRQLPGGTKIPNEFTLAEQFQVGRGTIREAVKLLISRNILEIRRGKGTFVCENPGMVDDPFGFSYTDDKVKLVADLVTVRVILEPEMAALAAKYAVAEEVERMEILAKKIDELARANEDFVDADDELHELIAHCSRNMVMPNLVPVIRYGIELYNHSLKKYETLKALTLHHDIIRAIKEKDGEAARKAMKKHLEYNEKNVGTLLGARK
jgi:DNA-binding FadR family transcriptional regulator